MGWFWETRSDSSVSDPYSKLDPALREFLDKESPLKYQDTLSSTRPKQPKPTAPQAPQSAPEPHSDKQTIATTSNPHAIPQESLYPDGRYAHLWASYRPQSQVEASGRNDQDKLRDVIDAFNDRKAAIGRAAVENCVNEQMAEADCWENGSLAERMNMCRGRNKAFMRCYTMQSRFLKALGYLSQMRSEEEEERIQMHADKLYHQMMDREEAEAEAKKAGVELEKDAPLIAPTAAKAALGEESAWEQVRQRAKDPEVALSAYVPARREQMKKQLEGLSERERELELQLIAAESTAKLAIAAQMDEKLEAERRAREDRRERGKETAGDTIQRLWRGV